MGQASPVSSRNATVKFANSRSVCCFQARTASTANSGRVCIQARIAKANPCATKNCADSAPQVMRREAIRIEGVVQSTAQGLACCKGAAANSSANPKKGRCFGALREGNLNIEIACALLQKGVFFKGR